MQTQKRQINPRKLLHSKWTAVKPVNKEKHFMVTRLMMPDLETQVITAVEIEAVMTGRRQEMPWRDLQNTELWKQGWVQ
ncbi:TIGR02450 family Trp-rich protein [Methylophilus aquaticus]|uniref:TIGR02450 family Trp-rich protein n=1 Tax=Methylophilus aquaticus TaxID=1971610 RepID=A0ABT9JUW0_9PROT|nr:TIGR02450 family Trp-rich protein [Methylophilus aquaticus]MDP8568367.1 TIGR02450 family Trp-rich protein [Methylophilus aquaticus]